MATSISSMGIDYINQQRLRTQSQRQSVITHAPISYVNKLILAPMVRIGTLPMRLLALQYGADIVYCEEIIDQKILRSTRIQNDILGTIDYVTSDGTTVFRTHPSERGKVVFQMGTADPDKAVRVAKMIENDVAAIDVNMGCPKDYSTKGGMGAALLSDPEKIKNILTALVQNTTKPITCKIRLLANLEDSISLVRMIESCGVAAVAIHGRRREERPRHPNHNDQIRELAKVVNIPVIANGGSKDISSFSDILGFRDDCSCSSVMVARAAQWNPSIFLKTGIKPLEQVIQDYLRIAAQFSNHVSNVKYVLQNMLQSQQNEVCGNRLKSAATLKEICAIWSMDEFYDEVIENQKRQYSEVVKPETTIKRQKLSDGSEMVCLPFIYNKHEYKDGSPKQVLNDHLHKTRNSAHYNTIQKDDMTFHCVLTVDNVKYTTTYCDKVKRNAEQSAAAVCLQSLGIPDGRSDIGTIGVQAIPLHVMTPDAIKQERLDLDLTADKSKKSSKTNSYAIISAKSDANIKTADGIHEGSDIVIGKIKSEGTLGTELINDKSGKKITTNSSTATSAKSTEGISPKVENEDASRQSSSSSTSDKPTLPKEHLEKLLRDAPLIRILLEALGGCDGVHKILSNPRIQDTGTALAACFHRLGGMSGLEELLGGSEAVKELQNSLFQHGGLLGLIATAAKLSTKSSGKDVLLEQADEASSTETSTICGSGSRKRKCPEDSPTFTSLIDSICEQQLRYEKNQETTSTQPKSSTSSGSSNDENS